MTDIRQTKEYAKHLINLGWQVERIENINYFIRAFPIIGAILKVQRPKDINFKVIDNIKTKYHVFHTIIEPLNNKQAEKITSRGYKLSKSPFLPSKTLILDLENNKDILKSFKKDTRYAINKSKKIIIIKNPDLPSFHESWRIMTGFSGTKMVILASHNGKEKSYNYSAGSIFLLSNDTAYYWMSFTGKFGRSTLSQSTLLYKGILWAIYKGAKCFDFEGIYDDRFPNKSWLGFSHFKKGFGGYEVLYPGAYTFTDFLRRKTA